MPASCGALCHRQRVRQIAKRFIAAHGITARRGWIDKDAQADVVEAVIFEDLENVFVHAAIEIGRAVGFIFGNPGNVRAEDKRTGSMKWLRCRRCGVRHKRHKKMENPQPRGKARPFRGGAPFCAI